MTAELLMLVGGIGGFLLTLYWVRNRDMREKYAVAWICVAFLLLLCGLFPGLIMTFADASRLSYPAAVLFVALAAFYLYSLSISVSLTRQYRRTMRLTQELALLEHRLRRLEQLSPPEQVGAQQGKLADSPCSAADDKTSVPGT